MLKASDLYPKTRASNIELLRIIAALGVMILHWNYNGGLALMRGGGGYYIFLLLECIDICAVNLFMLISGYYLCKNKVVDLWKPIEIITETIAISVFFELIKVLSGHKKFSLGAFVPNNYYVIFYITVLLISPLLNTVTENTKSKKRLLIGLLLIFSVYPTFVDILQSYILNLQDLSSITRAGSMDGYTIVNFVLMYLVGACVREMEGAIKKFKTSILFALWWACLLLIYVWTIYVCDSSDLAGAGTCLSYASPLIIMEAILIFLLFQRIDIGYNKNINRLAKASFTAYLFHGAVIKYFVSEKICSLFYGVVVVYVLISVMVIYGISWIVYCLYDCIMKNVFSILKKKVTLNDLYY